MLWTIPKPDIGARMNVLMLRPQIELGGVSAHIKLLAGGLIDQGHLVYVATGGGVLAPRLRAANIPVFNFPFSPSNPINLIRSVALLRRFVHEYQIDLLHSHHRFTTIIGRFVRGITRAPLIATVHEFKDDGKLTAALWARNTTIVASNALKAHLVSFYGVSSSDIFVIRHAIEPLKAATDRLHTDCAQSSSAGVADMLVGYVGRLSPEKGARFFVASIPLILQAFPAARFVVVGTGPEEPQLRALALELGLDPVALFVGSQVDVDALLERLDLVVIPSLFENFPLIAIEAMRAGCPAVASTVGGLPEVVRDGITGVLVPPGSPATLASAVGELLADAARRCRMSAQARQIFQAEYSPAVMVTRTLEVYQATWRAN